VGSLARASNPGFLEDS